MATSIDVYWGEDGNVVSNATEIPMSDISRALGEMVGGDDNQSLRMVMDTLGSWGNATQPQLDQRRLGGVFDRDRYVTPKTTFEQIHMARKAMADDVIGTAADVTESLAIGAMSIFTRDEDEQDVWNQWAGLVDLDSRLREWWLSLFTDSQVAGACWWERHTFDVRGLTEGGNSRRKKVSLDCPTAISFFDTTKVVPVGTRMFQREGLAYIADALEASEFDRIISGRDNTAPPRRSYRAVNRYSMTSNASSVEGSSGLDIVDPIVERLVRRRYVPTPAETIEMQREGIDTSNLFLLDSRFTFRHTVTKMTHDPFPMVRLKRAFPLLDLKAQVQQMDRAVLIGGASYIILITQGSEKVPGKPEEIEALKAGARMLGTIPLVVGDHRLKVEIISPKTDNTLKKERYDTIDVRLTALAYGTFAAAGNDSDDPLKTGRVIGTSLEGRRKMVGRAIEGQIFELIRLSNPDKLTARAKLRFLPKDISLTFDPNRANAMLDLRQNNDLSRGTALANLNIDQADEAIEREREAKHYDSVFKTFVAHGANPNDPAQGDPAAQPEAPGAQPTRLARRQGGRQKGGTRNGGGAAPGTGQGQESSNLRRSKVKPGDVEYVEDLENMSRSEVLAEAGTYSIKGRHQMKRDDMIDAIVDALNGDDDA